MDISCNSIDESVINKSLTKKHILSGRFETIESTNQEDDTEKVSAVIWYPNDIKILIPSTEMDLYNFKEHESNSDNKRDLRKGLMRSLVNSNLDFVVTSYDKENKIAIASRKIANEIKRKQNVNSLVEGSIIDVNVLNIGRSYVVVECYGFQTTIPMCEIAWGRIYNIRDYINTGDKVKAKILNFNKESCELYLSTKRTKKDPFDECITEQELFKKDSEYKAIIRDVVKNGIFVELKPGLTAMCNFPSLIHLTPKVGDLVLVKIKRFKKDKKYIDATILKLLQ